MYNHTKGNCEHSTISDAIQKVRQGNFNNSIAAAPRKYESVLNRIEKVGNFTTNYEQVMRAKSPIDKPKKAIFEIMPGFLKDNNLRIVYEALKVSFFLVYEYLNWLQQFKTNTEKKLFATFFTFSFSFHIQAYRLQQTIHDEISNMLKLIDKFRALAPTDEKSSTKITEHKNKIAEMLKILSHLKELLSNIHHISIESFLDLLTHKFNIIQTESSINELLNFDMQILPPLNFDADFYEPLNDDFSSLYLNDILRRCSELKREKTGKMDETIEAAVVTAEVVRDVVWPDIMDRLENLLDHRKKIKVDLKRLTSEEAAMVESIRNECVESIFNDLFQNKNNE